VEIPTGYLGGFMLTKRGRYWHIEFRLNGVRVSQSAKTDVRKDAQELEDALRRRMWKAQVLGIVERNWAEGVELWRSTKGAKRSIKRDEQILDLAGTRFTGRELGTITEGELAEHGREIAKRSTQSNASRHLAMLRSFFNLMAKHKYIARQLAVTLYKPTKFQAMVLPPELFTRFLEALPPATRAPVEFAKETGLRRSNVRLLHWTAARPGAPWVPYIAEGVAYIPETHAKAGRPITIPLSARAQEIIRGIEPRSELIFEGRWPSRKAWDKAAAEVGVAGLRFHDLRHTWCSDAIKRGIPEHIVQRLGGWQSNSMVKRYTSLAVEDLRKYVP
jgi:integrase